MKDSFIYHKDCGSFGEYKNVVEFLMPENWDTTKNNRIIFIDACIEKEIRYIISKGVRTIASCCGHGIVSPSVCVDDTSVEIMEELGYTRDHSLVDSMQINTFLLQGRRK